MIGQPPRRRGQDYDQRELDAWFDQIYRHSRSDTTTTQTTAPTQVTVVRQTTSPTQVVTVTSGGKRYLRWFAV